MAGGLIAEIPKPKRIHVILSKLMGGTMVFWVLWRLKHDWQEIVGHKYVFEKEDEEKAKQKHARSEWLSKQTLSWKGDTKSEKECQCSSGIRITQDCYLPSEKLYKIFEEP
ncbi:hypothetical protein P5673_012653, partial [Acropora cervicornis]